MKSHPRVTTGAHRGCSLRARPFGPGRPDAVLDHLEDDSLRSCHLRLQRGADRGRRSTAHSAPGSFRSVHLEAGRREVFRPAGRQRRVPGGTGGDSVRSGGNAAAALIGPVQVALEAEMRSAGPSAMCRTIRDVRPFILNERTSLRPVRLAVVPQGERASRQAALERADIARRGVRRHRRSRAGVSDPASMLRS